MEDLVGTINRTTVNSTAPLTRHELDKEDERPREKDQQRQMRFAGGRAIVRGEGIRRRRVVRRCVRAIHRTVRYVRAGGYLGVGVDHSVATDDDVVQREESVAFDAESANQRSVYPAAIAEREEIELCKARRRVDDDVLPDTSAKETVVQNLQ